MSARLYHEKWECIFDEEMRTNRETREFLENHPMIRIPPLDPRDAYFGKCNRYRNTIRGIIDNEDIR